jgi:hypothetical protein
VSVSTNLSTESFPACQPWQAVCQFRLLDLSLVGCRGSDQFNEHLTINSKHEPTLNTPTSYRFQKILQDNCAGFEHFLRKFFQIETRASSPSPAARHHRAARAADEITTDDSIQRSRKTTLFQVENIMFSRDASLRMHHAKMLTPQRTRRDQAHFDVRSPRSSGARIFFCQSQKTRREMRCAKDVAPSATLIAAPQRCDQRDRSARSSSSLEIAARRVS